MLLLLCLIYGSAAVVAVAWITALVHHSMALGWTFAYLVAINLVAFAFYVFDCKFVRLLKALHIRVPEIVLVWGLAFPGGWIGALAAMAVTGHKTGPDTADFRMKLMAAYAVSATLFLLVMVVGERPLISLKQADAVIARLVDIVMTVFRAALGAAGGLL